MANPNMRLVTHGKTATSRHIPTDETALIIEALRLAVVSINESVAVLEVRFPSSHLLESLRTYAERMTDLRKKLEA